jgi:transcriptional regulator with XRE-family HTH domain
MTTVTPTISELVNLLFEEILNPDARTFTEKEVSYQVNITHKTLKHIRTGKTSNPGIATIREISRLFGISLDFFDVASIEECYGFLNERDETATAVPSVSEITFRSLDLSEESRKDILQVIRWVEAAERERKQNSTD